MTRIALVVCFLASCTSSSGSATAITPAQQGAFAAAKAGTPDAPTMMAFTQLQGALTAAEWTSVAGIDWSTTNYDELAANPAFVHAWHVVYASGGSTSALRRGSRDGSGALPPEVAGFNFAGIRIDVNSILPLLAQGVALASASTACGPFAGQCFAAAVVIVGVHLITDYGFQVGGGSGGSTDPDETDQVGQVFDDGSSGPAM